MSVRTSLAPRERTPEEQAEHDRREMEAAAYAWLHRRRSERTVPAGDWRLVGPWDPVEPE